MSELPSVLSFSTSIADAKPPVPLPAQQYRATVHAVEVKPSKSSGDPVIHMTYRISPDQFPADYTDGNPDGEVITTYIVATDTPKHRWRLKQLCEWHGVAPTRDLDVMAFMGTEVLVQVTHETYQGQDQARIAPIGPA